MFDRLKSMFGSTHSGGSFRNATGIAFPVDDVAPASDPLWLGTLGESVEIRCDASILIMPDRDIPALASEGYLASPVLGEPAVPQPHKPSIHPVSTL
jgi:hypothetical protein